MRKLIFSILLASAAASPALAQDHGRWQNDSDQSDRAEARQQAREQRQEQRQEQRNEAREQRFDRGPQQQPQPQVESRRQQWQGGNFEGRRGQDHNNVQAQINDSPQQPAEDRRFERRDGGNWTGGDRRNWTGSQSQQTQTNGGWSRDRGSWSHDRDGDFRQRQAEQQNSWQDRNRQGSGTTWQHRNWANGAWDRNWRHDRRYDWRRYRDSHRSIFRIGIYYDPFGFNYRPYNIGYRMYPAYFGQRYWIDPGLYGLPYPPPGTQWVRYWNDAVLVDVYSGEVIDVIRDFFW